jgi:hypothetical protein
MEVDGLYGPDAVDAGSAGIEVDVFGSSDEVDATEIEGMSEVSGQGKGQQAIADCAGADYECTTEVARCLVLLFFDQLDYILWQGLVTIHYRVA